MAHERKNANRTATGRRDFGGGYQGTDHSGRGQHHASRGRHEPVGKGKQENPVEHARGGLHRQLWARRAREDAYHSSKSGWPGQNGKPQRKSAGTAQGNQLAQGLRRSQGRRQRGSIVWPVGGRSDQIREDFLFPISGLFAVQGRSNLKRSKSPLI